MKRSFFQAAVVSMLLYWCTTWTLTKRQKKKLDGNYTRMLRAILNKSWRQTIKVRRSRHAGHCWRSMDELISDVLLWIPSYGQAKAGCPARTYIQQLCEDTGCNPEDMQKGEVARDGQGYPCWRHDMMMMMMSFHLGYLILCCFFIIVCSPKYYFIEKRTVWFNVL